MYYEINIAKRNAKGEYHHYFATAKRSITTIEKAEEIYGELSKAFPEPEYNIMVSKFEKIGSLIDVNTFKNEKNNN